MGRDYYATPKGDGNYEATNWLNAISGPDIEYLINLSFGFL